MVPAGRVLGGEGLRVSDGAADLGDAAAAERSGGAAPAGQAGLRLQVTLTALLFPQGMTNACDIQGCGRHPLACSESLAS